MEYLIGFYLGANFILALYFKSENDDRWSWLQAFLMLFFGCAVYVFLFIKVIVECMSSSFEEYTNLRFYIKLFMGKYDNIPLDLQESFKARYYRLKEKENKSFKYRHQTFAVKLWMKRMGYL